MSLSLALSQSVSLSQERNHSGVTVHDRGCQKSNSIRVSGKPKGKTVQPTISKRTPPSSSLAWVEATRRGQVQSTRRLFAPLIYRLAIERSEENEEEEEEEEKEEKAAFWRRPLSSEYDKNKSRYM